MQHRIAALTLALVCAACFAPSADSVPLLPEEGVRIELSEEALDFTAIGATRALHATVLDAEGRPLRNARILWSSTDPSVASVDDGGVVTAVGRGRADVVAAYGGIAAKAHVRVLPPPPGLARIGISPKEPTLTFIGQSVALRAIALDAEGRELAEVLASWEVEDPSIAVVDRLGVLEAVDVGATRVKATILDGTLSSETTITVRPLPSSLHFLDAPASVVAGTPQPAPIRVEARDAGGHRVRTAGLHVELEAVYADERVVALGRAPLLDGVASFGAIVLVRAGAEIRLRARSDQAVGFGPPFAVTHADPVGLGFLDPPAFLEARVSQTLRVGVVDAFGNLVPEGSAEIRLLARDLDPAELAVAGLDVAATEGGFATFDLEIDGPGRIVLGAEADGWAPAEDLALRARWAFTSLALGEDHGCGLLRSGEALCFGDNAHGQLGRADLASALVPTPTLDKTRWKEIAAGHGYGCGISAEDEALCWGAVPGRAPTAEPVPLELPQRPWAVAVGADHACFLATDGAAHCFGGNAHGQLGNDALTPSAEPVAVLSPPLAALAAGDGFTCGLDFDGRPWCWGRNDEGQLGGASSNAFESSPVAVPEVSFVQLALGAGHACGLDAEGRIRCWGRSALGQIGDGRTGGEAVPRLVASERRFVHVAAGGDLGCALGEDGNVLCWGANDEGQIGRAELDEEFNPLPLPVDPPFDGARFSEVAAGTRHACAIEAGGTAYCWGAGEGGRLGTGDESRRRAPTPVRGTE